MYSDDACDVTMSAVYPHRASLKNMPGHGGNRTYDLWNTSPSSVAQLVRALHRNRRAAGSIPAREPIVAFFVTAPG